MMVRPIEAQAIMIHGMIVSTGEAGVNAKDREHDASGITLFLCGDVMTGRGVDQVLPHAGNPILYEQ